MEIGTGSGYQTALLAGFSKEVYTVERIRELSERAKKRLDGLGLNNIYYKVGTVAKVGLIMLLMIGSLSLLLQGVCLMIF